METEDVCYTLEAGLEKAIDMETRNFATYRDAYRRIQSGRVKALVKENALAALEHRYALEKAFFEETVALQDSGGSSTVMNLAVMLADQTLDADATEQDVMIHAIHSTKRIVDFYRGMATQCSGAPMEGLFRRLLEEESDHLAGLESLYESIYMPDN
jgi:rubrerythrin